MAPIKENQKRLTAWMSLELHQRIKKQALNQNISLTKYIIQTLVQRVMHDEALNK